MLNPEQVEDLAKKAELAARQAYCPYSKFAVGAAVLGESGRIFTGCNVENASYGLTICAERNALFSAVAEGERRIVAVAVYTPTERSTPPCGACRQVLNEFGPQATVLSVSKSGVNSQFRVDELLPQAFGPHNL